MTPDPGSKPVGIVTAMPSEASALGISGPYNEVIELSPDTRVFICGIGPGNARRATEALLGAGAGCLVSWGTAGGLAAHLDTGAVIIPPAVVCDDAAYETDKAWATRIGDSLVDKFPVFQQEIYSGGLLVNGTSEKLRLAEDTGAVAVDMESGVIAEIAAAAGVPLVCVRVVADPVSLSLPTIILAAIDDAGFVSIPRALQALIRSPGQTLATVQTVNHFRRATRVLSVIARRLGPRLLAP